MQIHFILFFIIFFYLEINNVIDEKENKKKKENKVFVLNVYCTLFACNLLPIIEREREKYIEMKNQKINIYTFIKMDESIMFDKLSYSNENERTN